MFLVSTAGLTPCPLFENDKIIQQPANLLTLTATYINAATSFIKAKTGQLCTSPFEVLYHEVCGYISEVVHVLVGAMMTLIVLGPVCGRKLNFHLPPSLPPSLPLPALRTPFFLYLAFQHTHHPQFAGEKFTDSSIRGTFGDALNELDWGVGQILDTLHEVGVDKNTFVFFTSDNG